MLASGSVEVGDRQWLQLQPGHSNKRRFSYFQILLYSPVLSVSGVKLAVTRPLSELTQKCMISAM